MEERITALEEEVEKLRGLLVNLDDFLQSLDSEAGRRMEVLENDILFTRSGLSEELWKLRKEMENPKQDHEARVRSLEQQMEQLNKEWKEEREQPKGNGKE
jgi:peptidoglycan hydrolase CwlO-like protein